MNQDEQLIFAKINEKIKLKNFSLNFLKRQDDTVTRILCTANSDGWSGIQFTIVSQPGCPLKVSSPVAPLFDPTDNRQDQLVRETNDFAKTTRSMGTLLEFIDSYLEVEGCDNDVDSHPLRGDQTSPISDLLRELEIGNESESSAVSSGSTASRQSSRSTTPTMSDRIDSYFGCP